MSSLCMKPGPGFPPESERVAHPRGLTAIVRTKPKKPGEWQYQQDAAEQENPKEKPA